MSHRDITMLAFKDYFQDKFIQGFSVLDVGCKDFALKKELEDYGLEWHGVDKKGDDIITQADMSAMPFPDNSFDIVFVCHSFEHCERPIEALREFDRIARKWIFISTPNPCEKQIMKGDPEHIFCLNPLQMKRLFQYVGIKEELIYLQTENITHEQDYNVISIGRKE